MEPWFVSVPAVNLFLLAWVPAVVELVQPPFSTAKGFKSSQSKDYTA